jgi:hypothetical protein
MWTSEIALKCKLAGCVCSEGSDHDEEIWVCQIIGNTGRLNILL